MLCFLRRYVIGGRTGKREAALLLLIIVSGLTVWAVWGEASGKDMPSTFGLLMILWPFTIGALASAFGLEHIKGPGK